MTVVKLKIHPDTAKNTQFSWNVIDRNSVNPLLVSDMQKELLQSNH